MSQPTLDDPDRYIDGDLAAAEAGVMEEGAPAPGWYCRDCACIVVNRTRHDTLHAAAQGIVGDGTE